MQHVRLIMVTQLGGINYFLRILAPKKLKKKEEE
jgi:hypothetical protein